MLYLINVTGLMPVVILIVNAVPVTPCQLAANEAGKGNLAAQRTSPSVDATWLLLSGGIALAIIGILYYAKGAIEGLREDADGVSLVVRNGTMLAGQILIIAGAIGITLAFMVTR